MEEDEVALVAGAPTRGGDYPMRRWGTSNGSRSGAFWICSKADCKQWTFCDKGVCHDCGAPAPKWVQQRQKAGGAGSGPTTSGNPNPTGGTLGQWQVAQSKAQRRKERRATAKEAKAAKAPTSGGDAEEEDEEVGSDMDRSRSSGSSIRTSYAPWTDEQLASTVAGLRALPHKPASVAAEIEAIEGEISKRATPITVAVPIHTLERKAMDKERKLRNKVAALETALQEATKVKDTAQLEEQKKAKELLEAKTELQEASIAVSKTKLSVSAKAHPEAVVSAVNDADLTQPEVRQVVNLFQSMLKEADRMARERASFLAQHGLQAMPDFAAVDPGDQHLLRNLQEMDNQLGKYGTTVVEGFTKAQGRQAEALAVLVGKQAQRAAGRPSATPANATATGGATPGGPTTASPAGTAKAGAAAATAAAPAGGDNEDMSAL